MSETPTYVTVTALNRYIHYKFDHDVHLKKVFLKGELSNFKASKKHFYFSIKDEESEISATMFYPVNSNLLFEPKDGVKVLVEGSIGVYQKKGTYSINVQKMTEDGIGELYQRFLILKDKLQKEGLFDDQWKKQIPSYPEHVAVITSATGDAIHDIVSTFNRRFPLTKIYLYPAQVQGTDAPKDLIRALKKVYEDQLVECLIIGRGGGSFEDLSCFNDETLARVLFASPIPTISAVGHEADYTIVDFIASLRAPTPTGAAMLLSKQKEDVLKEIQTYEKRLNTNVQNTIQHGQKAVDKLYQSYGIASFHELLKNKSQQLDLLVQQLDHKSPVKMIEQHNNDLTYYHHRLNQGITAKLASSNAMYQSVSQSVKASMVYQKIDGYVEKVNTLSKNMIETMQY
jgi:exodeoxyribonuclease VII large subunit